MNAGAPIQPDRSAPLHVVRDRPNCRLKVIGTRPEDLDEPGLKQLEEIIDRPESGFDKLIHYGRGDEELPWVRRGLLREGTIDGYFDDGSPAQLWSRFGPGRDESDMEAEHHRILVDCLAKQVRVPPPSAPGYRFRVASTEDAKSVARLLRVTFPDYPSPLDDASVEEKIRTGNALFLCTESDAGELAAVASAEIDHARRNAEMTDCATRPEHRGQGLMARVLWELEARLHEREGITDLYSLARAGEFGMNATFARLGYSFRGRLINNCRMPTGWESMNIWTHCSASRLEAAR